MNAYELARDICKEKGVSYLSFERPKVRIVARELLRLQAENIELRAKIAAMPKPAVVAESATTQPSAELSGNTGELPKKRRPVYRVSYDREGELDRVNAMCGPDKPAALRQHATAIRNGYPRVKLERSYEYEMPWEEITPVPVCATCSGRSQLYRATDYGGEWIPCPDCSAAQPATEQPRIWRILDRNGVPFATQTTSRATAWHWYRQPDASGIQYSTDNGETWVDEQAERERK